MTDNLMTDEDYLRAEGWAKNPSSPGWDHVIFWSHKEEGQPERYRGLARLDEALAFQRRRDSALGRRVRETLILAGFGPDEPIPPPEELRMMVQSWRHGEELRREFAKGPHPMAMRLSPPSLNRRGMTHPREGC